MDNGIGTIKFVLNVQVDGSLDQKEFAVLSQIFVQLGIQMVHVLHAILDMDLIMEFALFHPLQDQLILDAEIGIGKIKFVLLAHSDSSSITKYVNLFLHYVLPGVQLVPVHHATMATISKMVPVLLPL